MEKKFRVYVVNLDNNYYNGETKPEQIKLIS